MKVFVITNQSLYPDSSYYDAVGVASTYEGAKAMVDNFAKNFCDAVERHEYGEAFTFADIETFEDDNEVRIEDEGTGYFEQWNITEHEVMP